MKSLNMKLVLIALAVATLATPAFAQRQHQRVQIDQDTAGSQTYQSGPALHYPDFSAGRTGTVESEESGALFNLGR